MKNLIIWEFTSSWASGGHKKAIYRGQLPKKGACTICRGLGKKEGVGCF